MFDWLMTQWREIQWDLIIKISGQLGLTFVLTAVVGWQREEEEHNTGIRAFPIVGMASCGYLLILGPHPDVAAQSRVLQGLITGIGFIGGGAILKDGLTVRGTATAASVWNACVMGAASAMGHYSIAILLCALNVFTLRALLPIKVKLDHRTKSSGL